MDNSKNARRSLFLRNGQLLLQKRIAYWGERLSYPIKTFSERELRMATDNYRQDIGRSRSLLYKGCIDGRSIAVKVTRLVDANDDKARQVADEIAILSNISHKNVVKLLGCCLETQCPMLVYEFTAGGTTLSNHLRLCYPDMVPRPLRWSDRMRIAAEIVDALNYLHTHSSITVIHRDISSSNIWLDEHLTARIAGFDFSLLMPVDRRQDLERKIVGTCGYFAPEYIETGVVDEKTDVYNFGAVMLELLTGRSAHESLAEYFTSDKRDDPTPLIVKKGVLSEGRTQQIQAFGDIAMTCVSFNKEHRPSMKEVVQELRQIISSK